MTENISGHVSDEGMTSRNRDQALIFWLMIEYLGHLYLILLLFEKNARPRASGRAQAKRALVSHPLILVL